MARPRRSEEEKKTVRLFVRLTKNEYDDIKAGAAERSLSISDWVRVLIFKRLPRHRIKKIKLVDTTICSELCRQGGLLRMLYNEYGATRVFDKERSRRILDTIEDLMAKINLCIDNHLKRLAATDGDRETYTEE